MKSLEDDPKDVIGVNLHVAKIQKHCSDFSDLDEAEPCEDKLARCRFEYINACKTVAHRTPDAKKQDIYDAYAVIKALQPIFGKESFEN